MARSNRPLTDRQAEFAARARQRHGSLFSTAEFEHVLEHAPWTLWLSEFMPEVRRVATFTQGDGYPPGDLIGESSDVVFGTLVLSTFKKVCLHLPCRGFELSDLIQESSRILFEPSTDPFDDEVDDGFALLPEFLRDVAGRARDRLINAQQYRRSFWMTDPDDPDAPPKRHRQRRDKYAPLPPGCNPARPHNFSPLDATLDARELLSTLDPDERFVLERWYDRFSAKEIAVQLKTTPKTVRRIYIRAMKKLQAHLSSH